MSRSRLPPLKEPVAGDIDTHKAVPAVQNKKKIDNGIKGTGCADAEGVKCGF